ISSSGFDGNFLGGKYHPSAKRAVEADQRRRRNGEGGHELLPAIRYLAECNSLSLPAIHFSQTAGNLKSSTFGREWRIARIDGQSGGRRTFVTRWSYDRGSGPFV